jgi:RNA polymerase sigma-70 factor (ECF subfamily)
VRESAWINHILGGDKEAGERFVREFYPPLFRWLRYLTGSPEIAADLTQQTFVQAWKGLPEFQRRASLKTWLHRIAYHEYTHWLRDKHNHLSLEAVTHLPAPQISEEWETLVLPAMLQQLPEEQRAAFILYHIQELSIAETATALNTPTGTVKSRLYAARQRLRELMEAPAEAEAIALPETAKRPEGGACS